MTTVTFGGKELTLQQDAYASNYKDRVCYFAYAIDREGNDYLVRWETTAAWDNSLDQQDDESNACEWDSPDDAVLV
jgi:hypothetical protein